MNVRSPRYLTLLALVAPALAVPFAVSMVGPAAAERPDRVASLYVVDEWADGLPTLPPARYSRVEVAYDASFGITRDGQVRTAAFPWRPYLQAPAFDRPVVDVTAGTTFGLAVDDLGALHSWGQDSPVPDQDLAETYLDVAAVQDRAIGLTTDGELRYWGPSPWTFDEAEVAASDIVSIDINSASAVALTSDGKVLSAGYALDGTYYQSSVFPGDRADDTFVAVDAGVATAVALTDDGQIVTWGSYQHGEDQVPDLPVGRRAVAVSAGMWFSAAVLDDGSVITWGERERQQLPPLRAGLKVVDVHVDRYRTAVTYAALESISAPTITGTAEFGTELTASAGEWSDIPDDVHYEWTLRTSDAATVVGTDSATYTPTAADALAGGTLEVTVTAERDGFVSASSVSQRTAPVAQLQFSTAPVVTVAGTPRVGETLTATASEAVPASDQGVLTWFRAQAAPNGDVEPIDSADGARLTLTPDLVGAQVFARYAVVKSGYEPTSGESIATTVAPGTLGTASVAVTGVATVGQVLKASTNGTSPAAETTRYAWFTRDAGTLALVAGATTDTLTLTADLAGRDVVARATFARTGYDDVSADSSPRTVAAARLASPVVTVSGTPRIDQVLTGAVAGDPAAATTSYQWLRGTTPIAGATTASHRVTDADLGQTLSLRVTTSAAGHDDASATSAPTASVTRAAVTLRVKATKKVVAGKKATITITRLAAGETVMVKVRGRRVTTTASPSGRARVEMRVVGKPGKRLVKVVGETADRTGTTALKVVRATT